MDNSRDSVDLSKEEHYIKSRHKSRPISLSRRATVILAVLLIAVMALSAGLFWSLKQRTDGVDVVPLTLAGAGTENSPGDGHLEPELARESFVVRPAFMVMNTLMKNVRQIHPYDMTLPRDERMAGSLKEASYIGYKSLLFIRENRIMSYTDYATLLQIVEAECTGGDEKSKLLVADLILNRVRDERFPDSVYEVVWQSVGGQAQFSPTQDGRMGTLTISEETKNAVKRAVEGEDISEGALFFMARQYSESKSVEWFDRELVYLYSYGGHDFYKYKDDRHPGG